MKNVEVLVLHGSPGSGKSTLANIIADKLRSAGIPHAVIDIDELNRIYPETGNLIEWKNLGAIWHNYTNLGDIKIILPVLIDDQKNMDALRNATPSNKLTVCELIADESILKRRVREREPDQFWKDKLENLVTKYFTNTDKFGDFKIQTDHKTTDEISEEILKCVKWI
ncbi:MAG: zeta toxin family protein [bacterium]|nr:zeta toxin family protein [bacterium]